MAVTEAASSTVSITQGAGDTNVGSAQTTEGAYTLVMDLNGMANGDIVVIKAFVKCRSSSTSRLAFQQSYAHVQTELVAFSVPIPIAHEVQFKVNQTDGSSLGSTDYSILRS